VRVLDRAQELAQVGLHAGQRARRPVEQIVERVLALGGLDQRADLDPAAALGVLLETARDPHGRPRLQARGAVAHRGGHGAGAVAQRELDLLGPVARDAFRAVAHEEVEIDLLTVDELSHQHGANARAAPGRNSPRQPP
jgi:hypothetical protein